MKTLLRQIFVNFSFSGLVSVIEIAVTLSLSIVMPRFLGTAEYGIYVFAVSLVGLVFGFTEMGLGVIVTREVAKNPTDVFEILADALGLRMVFAFLGLIIVWVGSFLISTSEVTVWVLRIMSLTLFINNLVSIFISVLVGALRFKTYLVISAVYRFASFGLVLGALILWNGDVVLVALAFLLAQFITLLVTFGIVHKKIGPIRLRFNRLRWTYLIKESSPLMLANVSANFTLRSDSVMLGYFRGPVETGIYGAAYNLLLGIGSISASFLNAAFPTIAKTHTSEPNHSENLFRHLFLGYLFVGLVLAIGLTIFAEPLVILLYGPKFAASALPLRILGWGSCSIILNRLTTNTLNAMNLQKYTLYSSLLGAGLNVGLNFLLIPFWGYVGASLTTVIAETAVLIVAIIPLVRYYHRHHGIAYSFPVTGTSETVKRS